MKFDSNKDSQISPSTFYCFLPVVSLGTFGIEFVLALYVLYRFRSKPGRLSALLISILGIYQLMEFSICSIGEHLIFARIAFIAVAFLPIIALHIMQSESKHLRFIKTGYLLTFLLTIPLIASNSLVSTIRCTDYYIVFTGQPWYAVLYGSWYWILFLFGMYHAVRMMRLNLVDRKLGLWTLSALRVIITKSPMRFVITAP